MVFNRVKIDATRVTTCHEARFNTIERLVETRQVARLKPGGAAPVRIKVARPILNPVIASQTLWHITASMIYHVENMSYSTYNIVLQRFKHF